jgi:hypothetical protein
MDNRDRLQFVELGRLATEQNKSFVSMQAKTQDMIVSLIMSQANKSKELSKQFQFFRSRLDDIYN